MNNILETLRCIRDGGVFDPKSETAELVGLHYAITILEKLAGLVSTMEAYDKDLGYMIKEVKEETQRKGKKNADQDN